jgi:hypothetical protein
MYAVSTLLPVPDGFGRPDMSGIIHNVELHAGLDPDQLLDRPVRGEEPQ